MASTFLTRAVTNEVHVAANLFTVSARGGNGTSHLRIQSMGSEDGHVRVTSSGNRYVNRTTNTAGQGALTVFAGQTNSAYGSAARNRSEVVSVNDRFEHNATAIFVRGGNSGVDVRARDNEVVLELSAPTFVGNTVILNAAGAQAPASATPAVTAATSGNLVTLLVRHLALVPGSAAQSILLAHGVGPVGADNALRIVGSATAWQKTNPGVPTPADGFFAAGR